MSKFSMPPVRIFIASTFSVLVASQALAADIKVTTTAEELNNNGECSLQEAIAYLNKGVDSTQQDKESDCHPDDDKPTTKVVVDGEKNYVVTKEINIQNNMTISASNFDAINNQNGEDQPVIRTTGERIFNIDDNKASQQKVTVVIQGLELHGPYTEKKELAANIQDEGGLIFNRERLIIKQVRLRGGAANKGGAIYNASSDASLSITNVELSDNVSNLGAAVFSEFTNVSIQNSLIKNNVPLDSNKAGFALEIESTQTPTEIAAQNDSDDIPYILNPMNKLVTNTIFYQNDVGVMTLKPYMLVNNITAIGNNRGIDLDSGFDVKNPDNRQIIAARLANSVILNNKEYDLNIAKGDYTYINNVIVREGAGLVDATAQDKFKYKHDLVLLSSSETENLIAFKRDENKQPLKDENGTFICQPPTLDINKDKGLFCPLIQLEDEYVETLKPRLLMSYETISESKIVNKGAGADGKGLPKYSQACEGKDIRDEPRVTCDIGAFELVIDKKDTNGAKNVNDEIIYGEKATLNLKDAVGDGQLLPKKSCDQYVTNPPEQEGRDEPLWPSGKIGDWTDGCLLYTRLDKVPQKGSLIVNESADKLIYTPSSNFHGLDRFQYDIVTTTSRFSQSSNAKSVRVDSMVRQDPPDNFKSETINLGYGSGSGSFGAGSLLMLFGLYGLSRYRRQRELSDTSLFE